MFLNINPGKLKINLKWNSWNLSGDTFSEPHRLSLGSILWNNFSKCRKNLCGFNLMQLPEVVQRCSVKMVFLKISQNQQENTCTYCPPYFIQSIYSCLNLQIAVSKTLQTILRELLSIFPFRDVFLKNVTDKWKSHTSFSISVPYHFSFTQPYMITTSTSYIETELEKYPNSQRDRRPISFPILSEFRQIN